ncbi:MAG: pseudouridine-5'-phosphate glycosidase [Rhodobacteraceae bacterium]|nr:pseudouridine-5'-phosphate glycosidase [Paracoccaceae bacterium]
MILTLSDEIRDAQTDSRPIVALESTIITHGMPYPQNLQTARAVEQVVRDHGAAPATIAISNGQIHIGMPDDALDRLAQTPEAMKLSRADLAIALANGKTGATTVAATMICAARAGIEVFATGGIGGVHRGAEQSFDISADLRELSKTAVTVVCAGAKAILDLPKTLEVLETLGVPVIGYQTNVLPAFWSRSSDLAIPLRMESAAEIAAAHRERGEIRLEGGQLIANPIPIEAEIPSDYLNPIIAQAIAEAETQGITAKQVTPFLLARIVELTAGRSLRSNIALVKNNAKLGAEIAVALKGM